MILIAAIGAAAAILPPTLLLGLKLDRIAVAVPPMLLFSFVGSFLIGLPFTVATFHRVKDDPEFGFWELTLIANIIAFFIVIIATVFLGALGLIFMGPSIFVAANAFSIAGWHLLLKPYRQLQGD
jgi:hypothetical protein